MIGPCQMHKYLKFQSNQLLSFFKNIPGGLLIRIIPFKAKSKQLCRFLGHSFFRAPVVH